MGIVPLKGLSGFHFKGSGRLKGFEKYFFVDFERVPKFLPANSRYDEPIWTKPGTAVFVFIIATISR
jgi:hypothetical protein